MTGKWHLMVYRGLCRVDALGHAKGMRTRRFEYLTGSEDEMRGLFHEFAGDPQVLAVELYCRGSVVERFDRLMDTLPDVDPTALRLAILEPRLLAELPAAPTHPAG